MISQLRNYSSATHVTVSVARQNAPTTIDLGEWSKRTKDLDGEWWIEWTTTVGFLLKLTGFLLLCNSQSESALRPANRNCMYVLLCNCTAHRDLTNTYHMKHFETGSSNFFDRSLKFSELRTTSDWLKMETHNEGSCLSCLHL